MIATNVRTGHDEIDLLASIDGVRTVVEVKTSDERTGIDPMDHFDDEQLHRAWRAADSLTPPARRVDVIAITVGQTGYDVRWVPEIS